MKRGRLLKLAAIRQVRIVAYAVVFVAVFVVLSHIFLG